MTRFSRKLARPGLVVSAAALALATLAACGSEGGNGDGAETDLFAVPANEGEIATTIDTDKVKKKLVVGVSNPHYIFHNDILIALEKGYFAEVGIDDVEIKTLDEPIPALLGGSLDFANFDVDSSMSAAQASKAGLKFLAVTFGGEFVGLGVREGIDRAEDLNGKTVSGGELNSRNDANIRELLRANGLDPEKDVKMVATGGGSNERLAAIVSGTIDAGNIQLRHRELIAQEGGTILFEELRQAPQSGWVADRILEDEPETAAAFLTAVLKGRAYVDDPANKNEVVELLRKKGFDIPEEYVAAYADENATDYHTVDGGFEVNDMDKFIRDSITFETAPVGTKWRDHVYLSPLWRAQKKLGLPLRPALADF